MTWEENGTETLRVLTFSLVLTSLINRQRSGVSSLRAIDRYNSKRQDDWAKPGQDSHFNFMSEVGVDYKVSPRLHLNTFYDISFNEFSRYSNIGLGIAWLIN